MDVAILAASLTVPAFLSTRCFCLPTTATTTTRTSASSSALSSSSSSSAAAYNSSLSHHHPYYYQEQQQQQQQQQHHYGSSSFAGGGGIGLFRWGNGYKQPKRRRNNPWTFTVSLALSCCLFGLGLVEVAPNSWLLFLENNSSSSNPMLLSQAQQQQQQRQDFPQQIQRNEAEVKGRKRGGGASSIVYEVTDDMAAERLQEQHNDKEEEEEAQQQQQQQQHERAAVAVASAKSIMPLLRVPRVTITNAYRLILTLLSILSLIVIPAMIGGQVMLRIRLFSPFGVGGGGSSSNSSNKAPSAVVDPEDEKKQRKNKLLPIRLLKTCFKASIRFLIVTPLAYLWHRCGLSRHAHAAHSSSYGDTLPLTATMPSSSSSTALANAKHVNDTHPHSPGTTTNDDDPLHSNAAAQIKIFRKSRILGGVGGVLVTLTVLNCIGPWVMVIQQQQQQQQLQNADTTTSHVQRQQLQLQLQQQSMEDVTVKHHFANADANPAMDDWAEKFTFLLYETVSWLTAVGILISSLLNGFGSVSMPFSYVGGIFLQPIRPEAVTMAEIELQKAEESLDDRKMELEGGRNYSMGMAVCTVNATTLQPVLGKQQQPLHVVATPSPANGSACPSHAASSSSSPTSACTSTVTSSRPRRSFKPQQSFAEMGEEIAQRRRQLQQEIEFLETLLDDMREDLAEMKEAQYVAAQSRTRMGRLRTMLGIIFSIVLLVRLGADLYSLWHHHHTGRIIHDHITKLTFSTPRHGGTVDPITQALLWLTGHKYVKPQDFNTLSQFISLLLTAVLSVSQLRAFVQTIQAVNKWLQDVYQKWCYCTVFVRLSHPREPSVAEDAVLEATTSIYTHLVASLMACYVLACLVMTKMLVPLKYRQAFSAALGMMPSSSSLSSSTTLEETVGHVHHYHYHHDDRDASGNMNFVTTNIFHVRTHTIKAVFCSSALCSALILGLLLGIQRSNTLRHGKTWGTTTTTSAGAATPSLYDVESNINNSLLSTGRGQTVDP